MPDLSPKITNDQNMRQISSPLSHPWEKSHGNSIPIDKTAKMGTVYKS